MDNDLIDDNGFELGMPTHEELLRHMCDLLQAELDITRRDLRQAHKSLAGVITMYRQADKELSALRVEHERIRWALSDVHHRQSVLETSKMVYQYGDHCPGITPDRRS
ncbi:hypothetical protein [Pseudomonas veronii]